MSPIWITFALIMGGVLLAALIGIPLVLCHLDSQETPRVRHVERTPVTPRQRSIREIAAAQAKRDARGIDTCALRMIDDLHEMVHGNSRHEG